MPTPRRVLYAYPADPEAVLGLMRDPEFLKYRHEAVGEKNVEVQVEELPDGLHLVIARDKEVQLPGFARRLFNPKNRITDHQHWYRDGERWVAEYQVQIAGVPGHVRGTAALVPSPTGCDFVSAFEVTANVPLVGGKLESFLADRVEEALRLGTEHNVARLRA
jgi:hypothetical protein